MSKLSIKVVIFFFINIAIFVTYYSFTIGLHSRYTYHNYSTNSLLRVIPTNKTFDLVFLGSSRARQFSENKNIYYYVMKTLKQNFINLSKRGSGVVQENIYLKYFYKQGNKAKKVLIFIDPFMLFSRRMNSESPFAEDEPLNWDFYQILLDAKVERQIVINYFQSKLFPQWIKTKPEFKEPVTKEIGKLTERSTQRRLDFLYGKYKMSYLDEHIAILKNTVEIVRANGGTPIIIMLPTLLRNGETEIRAIEALTDFQIEKNVDFHNFSQIYDNFGMFKDHDHLNHQGVQLFTQERLLNIVEN